MDQPSTGAAALTPVKRALIEIRQLKAQLAKADAARREPIAIVGIALRTPGGATDLSSFAELLWSGTDAISEIPSSRWSADAFHSDDPDAPGKMTTRHGGFIDNVDRFDAELFGISPREAASMDPQQRLLLELAWQALEDAGYAPTSLNGTSTGVYVGISSNDYGRALYAHPGQIDVYFSTGNAFSVAAGRVAYVLGLRGPAISVDTACSSSLVALHLGCQGLRLGECDLALAAGVNLVLTPEMNINFSKARMLARDGRCKTFDAEADGYVRGEGCIVVALRRLSDALASNDRILAVVRGSAINQDGRSGGLTAPNGPAQEAVIRAALDAADAKPDAIRYVETHGTGTPLGDPIEVGALGAVLCEGRRANEPLLIGSVKTNIGHLEAAAGLAGVAKVIASFRRRSIPPHLHLTRGNPHIDWDRLALSVPTTVTPWPAGAGRLLAGVSSFGFSGTNAHVVLEEPPEQAAAETEQDRPLHFLALSARDGASLNELSARYQERLAGETNVADLCYTANAGRPHFDYRRAVIGADAETLRLGLAAPDIVTGHVSGAARPQVAFIFTGQGAQHAGMGRRLYETSPEFRAALDECASALASHLPRNLLDVMFEVGAGSPIDDSRYAQPATFAIQVALARLWRSWGIEPACVLGHSLGEYAAAFVAGVMSLADGVRLVADRGRLCSSLPAGGAMAAVFAPESVLTAELARTPNVSIAVHNGPAHFVISGEEAGVREIQGRLERAGVQVKLLRVPFAAHSSLVEPIVPEFARILDAVAFAPARVALLSNLTGRLVGNDEIGRPSYWLTHLRQPVRFASAMSALVARGITHVIELGPHPVLLAIGAESVPDGAIEWLPSLHREREDWTDLLESLRRLYLGGADVRWADFDRGYRRRRVAAPLTPLRHRRYWHDLLEQVSTPVSADERWARITRALASDAERGPLDLNPASYPAKWDLLSRLTFAHARKVLRGAGLFMRADERHSVDDVLRLGGIGAGYRHLVTRWLEGLEELTRDADDFVATRPLAEPPLPALWAEAERQFTDNHALLAYVRHCGDLVGPVLTGRESPLETLFPDGSFDLAEGLYERSSTMRYINGLAASAVDAFAATGAAMRILEVGAGTGSTTSSLLPRLSPERTRYRFTDVTDMLLARARERFAAYRFVEYGRFDLDAEPAAQGYVPGTFDLIISANAVHASKNLRLALERLRELLAPGGVLLLVESTTHLEWFDMTTGLIEGWQHFDDDLRGDHPLLSAEAWLRALREAGFVAAAAWPGRGSVAERLGQHVVVARVSGEAGKAGTWPAADAPAVTSSEETARDPGAELRQRIADALPADRLELLRDFVRATVVRVLHLDPSDPPGRSAHLTDLGFDSLMAVQLRGQLTAGLGLDRRLPATIMFDYPTIDALAARLLDLLAPPGESSHEVVVAPATVSPRLGEAAVAAMTDEEVEALLLERLERK